MRVVCAPNAFKGTLTAFQAAAAIRAGLLAARPELLVDSIPMADGGDGTAQVLLEACGGSWVELEVSGPLGNPLPSRYARLIGGTAVVEMAAGSGLVLVEPARRNPLLASSSGTGQLLLHALRSGPGPVILGVGGSATVDGGVGLLQALGVAFLDARGHELAPGGGSLAGLARIDTSQVDPAFDPSRVLVAADVSNQLLGPRGAAAVYGPQKGADAAAVAVLEAGLANLAAAIARELGRDVTGIRSGGAAGGAAAGLAGLGVAVVSGGEAVAEQLRLRSRLEGAAAVITGEGQIDDQTSEDKAPAVVARLAAELGIPCLALAGALGPGWEGLRGTMFAELRQVTPGGATQQLAPAGAAALLEAGARELADSLPQ